MTIAIFQFIGCAAVIVVMGTILTKCADAIAEITKLGRLLVGSIFLAGATSLPELMVDVSAVRMNLPDMAVGDLMGSGLCNLMILAILDLLTRPRGQMLSKVAAGHALSGTMSMALISLAAISILIGKETGGFHILGIGLGVWAIAIAYVLGLRMVYFDQRYAAEKGPLKTEVLMPAGHMSLKKAIFGYLFAAAAIVVVAPYLAEAAGTIADKSGLGGTFVGTTLVAFCTSLPELVASLAAVRMGAADLAIGNVFGSNSFNMLLLLPLDYVYPGSLMANVSSTHAISAIACVVITAVGVLGQLYQVERRKRLIEPDAFAIMILVIGAMSLVFYLR